MTAIPSRQRQLIDGVWQYVTFDESGGGGGGSQPMLTVKLPLTNADIIALGTGVPFEILPSPTLGQFYNIIFALVTVDASAGAYGNINASPIIGVEHSGASFAVADHGEITGLLGGDDVAAWLPIFPTPTYGDATPDQPLNLFFYNGGDGEFTGGNAANSGFVKVWYSLEDLP